MECARYCLSTETKVHDEVIKWKHFPRYWPFLRAIYRSTFMFSLICAWTNGWANNRDTGDLRRHHTHYGVTAMQERVLSKSSQIANFVATGAAGCHNGNLWCRHWGQSLHHDGSCTWQWVTMHVYVPDTLSLPNQTSVSQWPYRTEPPHPLRSMETCQIILSCLRRSRHL